MNTCLPYPSQLFRVLAGLLAAQSVASAADVAFTDDNWMSMGGRHGISGEVQAAALDASGNLYIGGGFESVEGTPALNIAKWDGRSWSPLGSGIEAGEVPRSCWVYALTILGSDVFAGGTFTTAGGVLVNGIAKWDGNHWSALGSGMNKDVLALTVFDGELVAGGLFTEAGGVEASRIAKWNGDTWAPLGAGLSGVPTSLAVSGSALYALFGTATGYAIAQWDGASWTVMDSPAGGKIAVAGEALYLRGTFSVLSGVRPATLAKWDGGQWLGLPLSHLGPVIDITSAGSKLYAAIRLGANQFDVIEWEDSEWQAVGSPFASYVYSVSELSLLAASNSRLFAAGLNSSTTILPRQWDGTQWSVHEEKLTVNLRGAGTLLNAIAAGENEVYAGGEIIAADGRAAGGVASWDGEGWAPVGLGVSGRVNALALADGGLYAGGSFAMARGEPLYNVAIWDGSSWSVLGSGVDGTVHCLAVMDGLLYAAGSFTSAGGVSASRIARWDGIHWTPLGSGLSGTVNALHAWNGNLYAGGDFTSAGGSPAQNVAKWDGSQWSPLGDGLASGCSALAVLGNTLYAAQASLSTPLVAWDGSTWSPASPAISNGSLLALAASGTDLYAGGAFTSMGGIQVNGICRWDGTAWSPLGSGLGGAIQPTAGALAIANGFLYAGGTFTSAGGKISAYMARAILPTSTGPIEVRLHSESAGFVEGRFRFLFSGTPGATIIVEGSTGLTGWEPLQTYSLSAEPEAFTDADPSADGRRFYRLRVE